MYKEHLNRNLAAISIQLVKFAVRPEEGFLLLVGCAKDYILKPRQCTEGVVFTYRFLPGNTLQLVHETPVSLRRLF